MLAFKCAYNQPKQTIVDNIQDSIQSRGGSLDGDTETGSFDIGERLGRLSGHYRFDAQQIMISITRKPIYISNQHIESEIRAYFNRQLIGAFSEQAAVQEAFVEDNELELVNS